MKANLFSRTRCWRLQAAALFIGFAACASARALDYQVHGYAAQGYVYSDDNNVFGESSHGSGDYYEAGLNAALQPRPNLLFAAQAAIRDAGISDDGTLRLDYALVDYRFMSDVDSTAGVRVGKVKNALGFFNDTRDVIFTRPGILMPGVYSDNQNQRSLIFTGPGAQLFGSRVLGRHELSLVGTLGDDRNVRRSDERLLIDLGGLPFDLRIEDSWNARLMDSLDNGKWQLALSHFFGRFELTTPATVGVAGRFNVSLTVFSARYNAEKFTVTTEYVRNPNRNRVTLGGATILSTRVVADRGYLQGDYRFNTRWGAFARIDLSFNDTHDRSGREFAAANPGADRRSRFTREVVLGVNWKSGVHWGVWGEYHWIDGTASLQALENPGATRAGRWSLLMLMAAFKF
jgi:hypothetical protein